MNDTYVEDSSALAVRSGWLHFSDTGFSSSKTLRPHEHATFKMLNDHLKHLSTSPASLPFMTFMSPVPTSPYLISASNLGSSCWHDWDFRSVSTNSSRCSNAVSTAEAKFHMCHAKSKLHHHASLILQEFGMCLFLVVETLESILSRCSTHLESLFSSPLMLFAWIQYAPFSCCGDSWEHPF